jgi:4-amino-4-deoxy-L-arabinose transferase-like glycosyltransferase
LLVYFAPFAFSGHGIADRGLAMVFRENLQRFFNPVNHKGPIYLYAWVIFGLFAPWSALLLAALIHHGRNESRSARIFAMIFFWATFLFFTLSASRRSYYLLPILPAAALLVARLLATPTQEISRATRWSLLAGFAALSLLVAGLGLALLPASWMLPGSWAHLPALPARAIFAGGWLGLMIVVVAVWRRLILTRDCFNPVAAGFSPRFSQAKACGYGGLATVSRDLRSELTTYLATACSVIAISTMIYFYLVALPATEPLRWQRGFAADVWQATAGDSDGLALYRTRDVVYYLDPPADIAEYQSESDLKSAVEAGRVRWLIVREQDLARLALPLTVAVREPAFAWDTAGNRAVLARCVQTGR